MATKIIESASDFFNKVVENKIPYDNHCSDLYIPVNDVTKRLVKDYVFGCNAEIFTSQIDKKQWYDLPFTYGAYYDEN